MELVALSANTSFGGLPVLLKLPARDDYVPHVFGLKADRHVHRHGVVWLAVVSAALLDRRKKRLGIGRIPEPPHRECSLVFVPVSSLTRLTSEARPPPPPSPSATRSAPSPSATRTSRTWRSARPWCAAGPCGTPVYPSSGSPPPGAR